LEEIPISRKVAMISGGVETGTWATNISCGRGLVGVLAGDRNKLVFGVEGQARGGAILNQK
jgi:hypothetical protein